jgi:hypothetical protein
MHTEDDEYSLMVTTSPISVSNDEKEIMILVGWLLATNHEHSSIP